MVEIIDEAIVLDKEDLGEYDSRVILFTKDLGKICAKATALRKIVSKLAAHLEPLNYVTVRLMAKRDNILDGRGFQIADALLLDNAKALKSDVEKFKEVLKVFNAISRLAPEGAPDKELWDLLCGIRQGLKMAVGDTLKFFGFDSRFAVCELCRGKNPEFFFCKNNYFICRLCGLEKQFLKSDLIKA